MVSKTAPDTPPLLLLGRLDGRLRHSPAADIWLARARLHGVATLSDLAGVSVTVDQLTDWICGRTLPPRSGEGLNDPMSIAAVLHFALICQEAKPDLVASATLNVLRSLLDDRTEAETWAASDLLRFGPAFREAKSRMEHPYPAPTLQALAERIFETQAALRVPSAAAPLVTSIDGRELQIETKSFGALWLIACHLPHALMLAGLTTRPLPLLTRLPTFLPRSAELLAETLETQIGRLATKGLAELDALERRVAAIPDSLKVTRRSKAPTLFRLALAYPGLRVPAIARLLAVSAQGAAKLEKQVRPYLLPYRSTGASAKPT